MRTYEVIETEEYTAIKATEGEKILWIPTDPNNSDYAQYLAFTAWVDAGNDPNEFGQEEI
jgi:hypothetical protein